MEIIHKAALAAMIILAITLSITITHSQTTQKPCSAPEASQFDFWVGSWELSWKDPDGTTKTGSNVITKIFDGCVIEENFTSGDGTFTGKSVSMYNPVKQIWQQTWVDNNGAYMDFTGGKDGDNMYMQRKVINKTGKEINQKMTFTDIKENSFTWLWESSGDNGATWNQIWKINYTRK